MTPILLTDRLKGGAAVLCLVPSAATRGDRSRNQNQFPSFGERHQTAAPSLVSSQPDAQNRLLLCLVPTMSHAGMDLGPRFDRARNLTPGLPPSSLAL